MAIEELSYDREPTIYRFNPTSRSLSVFLRDAQRRSPLGLVVGEYGTPLVAGNPDYGKRVNVRVGGSGAAEFKVPVLSHVDGAKVYGQPAYLLAGSGRMLALGGVGVPDTTRGAVPVGGVLPFAGRSAPADFLLCDGARYRARDYPALHEVIGYDHGGEGEEFNVPDLRQKAALASIIRAA